MKKTSFKRQRKHQLIKKTILAILFLFGYGVFYWLAMASVKADMPIYVNSAMADDSGDGLTVETAKKYIQSGLDLVGSGSTVYVADGVYDLTATILINKEISLIGNPAHPNLVVINAPTGDNQTAFLVSSTNASINGFKIIGANSSGYGIENNSATNLAVKNNQISGFTYGIYFHDRANFGTLENNTVNNNSNSGLAFNDSSNNTLSSNTASGNFFNGFLFSSDSNNNTLLNNNANSNQDNGIHFVASHSNSLTGNTANANLSMGFLFDTGCDYNTLTSNSASQNPTFGFYLVESPNNTLINNTANTNGSAGFALEASSNNALTGNTANANEIGFYLFSFEDLGANGNSSANIFTNTSAQNNTIIDLNDSSGGNTFVSSTYGASSPVDLVYFDTTADDKAISAFTIPNQVGVTAINQTAKTITVTLPAGATAMNLVPTITMDGASVSPASGVAQDFITPTNYTVTARNATTQVYTVRVIVLSSSQTFLDANGLTTLNNTTSQAVVTNASQAITATISGDALSPTLDLGLFTNNGVVTAPAININSGLANIAIPQATTITSTDASWNGVLVAPTATSVSLPTAGGETRTLSLAIAVGSGASKLSFNKAVRILLPGQMGKRVAFVGTGQEFTEINLVCSADNQMVGDALADNSECKINIGNDLIIWTKHFTSFVTFSSTSINVGGGGSGGATIANTIEINTATIPVVARTDTDWFVMEAGRADIWRDGVIDILDFNTLMVTWSQQGTNNKSDVNQDGVVDVFDLNILIANWGKIEPKL